MATPPRLLPPSGEPRRGLNPRIAASNRWARLEAIQRLKEFLARYAHALARFVSGQRSVVFPSGTYRMHVFLGARCEDPAPPDVCRSRHGFEISAAALLARFAAPADSLVNVARLGSRGRGP
ncbi:MAG: hypothetical protein AB7I09_02305, partial [Planctomycetota bacterium]